MSSSQSCTLNIHAEESFVNKVPRWLNVLHWLSDGTGSDEKGWDQASVLTSLWPWALWVKVKMCGVIKVTLSGIQFLTMPVTLPYEGFSARETCYNSISVISRTKLECSNAHWLCLRATPKQMCDVSSVFTKQVMLSWIDVIFYCRLLLRGQGL